MKKFLLFFMLPFQLMSFTVGPDDTVFVITQADPVLSVKKAAEELKNLLSQRTGAKIKIATASPAGSKAIYLAAQDSSNIASDGFVIKIQGNRIDIYGNDTPERGPDDPFDFFFSVKSRGTYNGVCRFLNKYCGIDWIAPGSLGLCMPPMGKIYIPDGILLDAPAFMMRNTTDVYEFRYKTGYLDRKEYHEDFQNALPIWASRLGFSSQMFPVFGCHTISRLQLYQNFGKKYPEYFSLQKDGSRGGISGGLCWSNKNIPQFLFKIVDAFFSGQSPRTVGLNYSHWPLPFSLDKNSFMIDPIDEFEKSNCQCIQCKNKTPEYFCKQVWTCIAQIADMVKNKYPGKTITTLAYPPKLEPPDFPLPDNIMVRLTMPGPNGIVDEITHEYYLNLLKKWHSILKRPVPIWIYFVAHDYGTAGAVETLPELYQQFLQEIRPYCDSIYFEHPSKTQAQRNFDLYVHAKLLWDPDADIDKIRTHYCRIGYGEAAEEIKKFYEQLEYLWQRILKETWDRGNERIPSLIDGNWKKNQSNRYIFQKIYTAETLINLSRLLQTGRRKVAADSIYAQRIDLLQKYIIDIAVQERESVIFAANAAGKTEAVMCMLDSPPSAADWKNASWHKLNRFVEQRNEKLQASGKFKILLDKQNLYIRAELDEPLIEKSKTVVKHTPETIKNIWKDNDLEIFINNRSIHRQFICNDRGAFHINDIFSDGVKPFSENADGVKVRALRKKDKWTVDITLPHHITGISTEASQCRFNVIRARNINGLKTEHSTWSNAVSFASTFNRDNYGRLVWTNKSSMQIIYKQLAQKTTDANMKLYKKFNFDQKPGPEWHIWNSPVKPAKHSYDAQTGYTKAGSLKIEYTSKASGSYSYWVPVKPGERIRVTAHLKHSSGAVECESGFMDAKNRWVEYFKYNGRCNVPSYGKWIKCSWEISVPDDTLIRQMLIGFNALNTPAVLWIDDVMIEKL